MATIKAVREALATYIENACGLDCKSRMPDQVNPPVAIILPGNPYVRYGITLGESLMTPGLLAPVPAPVEVNLVVMIVASRAASLEDAQDRIDKYLGLEPADDTVSIPVALAVDPTLGGMVEYVETQVVSAYGQVEIAGQQYFSGRINLQVAVSQSVGP